MRPIKREDRRAVVDQCVVYLCNQGCEKVSGFIDALQNDRDVPGLPDLDAEERHAVLNELISIMSVYGD